MNHPFFDSAQYPFDRPEGAALLNELANAFRKPEQIDLIYKSCRTGLPALFLGQPPVLLWKDVLETLTSQGLLPALLEHIRVTYPNHEQLQTAARDVRNAGTATTTSQSYSLIFVHDYNLPQNFVARQNELSRLCELVTSSNGNASRVVTITAIGGVGKSCLCRALIEQQEIPARFSRAIWFSFYEARVESEEHFLHEVLVHGFDWHDGGTPLEGSKEAGRLRRALCEELDRHKSLLVLDGLEVIQHTDDPDAPTYGDIKPAWNEVEKLLRHLLNSPPSVCVVTSRVPLRKLENLRGYHNLSLDLFEPNDGAQLLFSLGVTGNTKALEACAEILGGHALSLVAAGRLMARRRIAADRSSELIGEPKLFRSTSEGERVKRICDWYRAELSEEQEYFLTRLSLHGRAVTERNYAVLIRNYQGPESHSQVEEDIVEPLVQRGLVDRLESTDGVFRYTAHPLMKLAFSTWLNPEDRKQAHRDWAQAATADPSLSLLSFSATSLDELQPLVDAAEQYLAAEDRDEAWRICFAFPGMIERLGRLGYFQLAFRLTRQFDVVDASANWRPADEIVLLDKLAWLCARLGKVEEKLSYSRRQLATARQANHPRLPEVEALVAASLASSGYVKEAANIGSTDLTARGTIALMQGNYAVATDLLSQVMKTAFGHSRTVTAQLLGDALSRSDKAADANEVLIKALAIATENKYACCERSILGRLTNVALSCNDLPAAERWDERLTELSTRLDLADERNYWLLLAQGDLDGALQVTEGSPNTPAGRITQKVALARIRLHQQRFDEARAELEAAEREQAETGFARYKNELENIRAELERETTLNNSN